MGTNDLSSSGLTLWVPLPGEGGKGGRGEYRVRYQSNRGTWIHVNWNDLYSAAVGIVYIWGFPMVIATAYFLISYRLLNIAFAYTYLTSLRDGLIIATINRLISYAYLSRLPPPFPGFPQLRPAVRYGSPMTLPSCSISSRYKQVRHLDSCHPRARSCGSAVKCTNVLWYINQAKKNYLDEVPITKL